MNKQINTFIEFLLDTQATSDVLFNETISKDTIFFERQYLLIYQKIVDRKLQQWKDYYQKEQRAIAEQSSEESSESNSEDDDDDYDEAEEEEERNKDEKPSKSTAQVRDVELINIRSLNRFRSFQPLNKKTVFSIQLDNANDFFNSSIIANKSIVISPNFIFKHSKNVFNSTMTISRLQHSNKLLYILLIMIKIVNVLLHICQILLKYVKYISRFYQPLKLY